MEPYHVKLQGFEGPLDLLLHLVQQAEVDLYDIPVAEITAQYMKYIRAMRQLELDVASEYLVMASTLLAIKSKMLLPKPDLYDEQFEDEEWLEEDPREELAEQLVLYRKYKEASQHLKEKEMERAKLYSKSPTDVDIDVSETEQTNDPLDVSMTDLIQAFQRMNQRIRFEKPRETTMQAEEWTIEEKMNTIVSRISEVHMRVSFQETFTNGPVNEQVTTFIALLQLMKDGRVSCYQDDNFSDIYIERRIV
ncbi:segregation and condensation protein A [Geomicrobium sp. JCM 19037]|uniref:segregation/condensation protein A n=1 Tax=unclassified Geomicrobium TaxID=2628951 RepID=UPI00045F4061|nr:segregation/condensation protein A [Geomicrobium sp. JCM 19037]GAK02355.1 segregation and condensation protein A [Geomicrobium sp. JCM 19037]